MNRILRVVPLLCGIAWTDRPARAEPLRLTFENNPTAYMIGTEAHTDRWAYFVTRGVSFFPITGKRQVNRFLDWTVDNDRAACALKTRGNYVAMVRRVPESFANASRLKWTWHVTQDTPLGRFGERPDDQALQVILIFKRPCPEEFMAVSFAWTRAAERDRVLYTTRLPQDNFPRVQVSVQRRRTGRLPPQHEEIDIPKAFRAAVAAHGDEFTKHAEPVPDLFGIVLFGESSNQRPPVSRERMSTEARVSDLELAK